MRTDIVSIQFNIEIKIALCFNVWICNYIGYVSINIFLIRLFESTHFSYNPLRFINNCFEICQYLVYYLVT